METNVVVGIGSLLLESPLKRNHRQGTEVNVSAFPGRMGTVVEPRPTSNASAEPTEPTKPTDPADGSAMATGLAIGAAVLAVVVGTCAVCYCRKKGCESTKQDCNSSHDLEAGRQCNSGSIWRQAGPAPTLLQKNGKQLCV